MRMKVFAALLMGAIVLAGCLVLVQHAAPVLGPLFAQKPAMVSFSGGFNPGEYTYAPGPDMQLASGWWSMKGVCGSNGFEIRFLEITGLDNPTITIRVVEPEQNVLTLHAGDEIQILNPCTGQREAIGRIKLVEPNPQELPEFMQRYVRDYPVFVFELYANSWVAQHYSGPRMQETFEEVEPAFEW